MGRRWQAFKTWWRELWIQPAPDDEQVNNIQEFCSWLLPCWPSDEEPFTIEDVERMASRRLYKDTACGAWLKFLKTPKTKKVKRAFEVMLSQEQGPLGIVKVFERLGRELRPLEAGQHPKTLMQYLLIEPFDGMAFGAENKPLGEHRLAELFPESNSAMTLEPTVGGHIWRPAGPDKGTLVVVIDDEQAEERSIPFGVYGVLIGSIVEGTDAEVTGDELYFPFKRSDWDWQVANVESDVKEIWDRTHGCPHCFTNSTCKDVSEEECPYCFVSEPVYQKQYRDDEGKVICGTPGDGNVDPDCKHCQGDGIPI